MPSANPARPSPFPDSGGECAAILQAIDWDTHPLGPPTDWPTELRTAVGIALTARFPTMIHWDPDYWTFYNDAYAARLGRKHPGQLGQPAQDWWAEMWDQLTPVFDRVMAGESFFTENARYTPDRDGAPRDAWFTHSHSPIRDDAGAVRGIFVVVTETTGQVLAEQGRQHDVRLHRQIVDSATDFAIIATDLDGRVTRWNAGAANILGWTEAEMCGDTVERIFTPEDRAISRAAHEMRCALELGHGNDERWHLRRDGTRFWAQGEMTPLRTGDGTVTGFVKVLRDRTAERLREQRADLLARASAGLLSSDDPDRILQDILASGGEVLGYDQSYSYLLNDDCSRMRLLRSNGLEQDVRDTLADACVADVPLCGVVAEQRSPLILDDIQHSDHPRAAFGRRLGIRAYAGFPIMAEDRLFGVISFASRTQDRFDDGALAFFASFARFLSIGRERLEREAALSDLAMTLERRIEERTRALLASEDALRQSQKMDAVGQLTGGVAHDFNNLLTVIRGSVDLLRRPDLPAERRARYIDAIGDTADRAARLIGQLLAFARRQTLRPEVFDAGMRLREIGDMLNSVTGNMVEVVLDIPDDDCLVRADVSQFETALVNMAVNARDAMEGEGRLSIGLRCGAAMPMIRGHAAVDRPFVAVTLADTGAGIPAEAIGRIFEPFFTTKGIGKGTGLGLSQVFGFAKQSGGDVDVESRAGEGTCFTLYLPMADEGAQPATVEPAPSARQVDQGLCILIVEDNLEVGRFSTEMLRDLGYRTALVASAEEALVRLEPDGGGFDAVFSDVMMPGIGGLELAKRLRRDRPGLPVILASGYSHILAQEGAHGFELIQKPYSADQLSCVLERVIAGHPS